jgi:hypothetical protein
LVEVYFIILANCEVFPVNAIALYLTKPQRSEKLFEEGSYAEGRGQKEQVRRG